MAHIKPLFHLHGEFRDIAILDDGMFVCEINTNYYMYNRHSKCVHMFGYKFGETRVNDNTIYHNTRSTCEYVYVLKNSGGKIIESDHIHILGCGGPEVIEFDGKLIVGDGVVVTCDGKKVYYVDNGSREKMARVTTSSGDHICMCNSKYGWAIDVFTGCKFMYMHLFNGWAMQCGLYSQLVQYVPGPHIAAQWCDGHLYVVSACEGRVMLTCFNSGIEFMWSKSIGEFGRDLYTCSLRMPYIMLNCCDGVHTYEVANVMPIFDFHTQYKLMRFADVGFVFGA